MGSISLQTGVLTEPSVPTPGSEEVLTQRPQHFWEVGGNLDTPRFAGLKFGSWLSLGSLTTRVLSNASLAGREEWGSYFFAPYANFKNQRVEINLGFSPPAMSYGSVVRGFDAFNFLDPTYPLLPFNAFGASATVALRGSWNLVAGLYNFDAIKTLALGAIGGLTWDNSTHKAYALLAGADSAPQRSTVAFPDGAPDRARFVLGNLGGKYKVSSLFTLTADSVFRQEWNRDKQSNAFKFALWTQISLFPQEHRYLKYGELIARAAAAVTHAQEPAFDENENPTRPIISTRAGGQFAARLNLGATAVLKEEKFRAEGVSYSCDKGEVCLQVLVYGAYSAGNLLQDGSIQESDQGAFHAGDGGLKMVLTY